MKYLKLFEQWAQQIVDPFVERLDEDNIESVGREFQHIEDLVYIYGIEGAKRALERLETIAQNSEHMEVKWDGSPAIIFGRDENGTFHIGDKYSREVVDSGDKVYQQYVGRSGANVSDDRKRFAADMGALWDIYEQATPKDYRGFIEGGLLYKTTPPLENGEYVFQPNTVIYHVDQNTPLGKRIGASISGSAATAYFDNLPALGGRRITTDLPKLIQGVGSREVVIVPPKYATEVRAQVPTEKLQQVKNFINSSASRIEQFITPSKEWTETYPDVQTATKKWREVIYKYVNSQVDNPGGLESLGNNMAEWAETDPILTKGRRPLAINKIKSDVSGMKATFLTVRAIMHLKDTIVDQLENKTLGSLGIRAELPGGVKGGEGFVSDPLGGSQPLKFVKRGTFTAANRQKGRVSMKENKNNIESFDLIFNTTTINENQIYDYFKSKYKNYGSESFPQRMVSGIRKINETREHADIKPFIDKLTQIDYPKKIKVGDKLAIIDFEFVFAWKEIEVRGFTVPKTITKIVHSDEKINYVEFEDGDRYPRQTPATYSGRPMEYAAYFKKSGSAERALTMMSLMLPDEWNMNTSEVELTSSTNESNEKTINKKTAVVGWGRGMGHKGHMYLSESVIDYANKIGATPFFFVSETVGPDDPLDPKTKLAIYRKVFPKDRDIFHTGKNPVQVLELVHEQGYNNLVFMVGADQKNSFQFLARPTKSTGELPIPFDSVRVISRQETGSKTSDLEGPRATPMREILRDPDATFQEQFSVWRDAMPERLTDTDIKRLMKMAAKKMGVELNLSEAEPPPQGSTISPISGTPMELQPQPSKREIADYNREMNDIKRFMQGNG
jgi:hypothetical protein